MWKIKRSTVEKRVYKNNTRYFRTILQVNLLSTVFPIVPGLVRISKISKSVLMEKHEKEIKQGKTNCW
jgi:hypothetical protein